MKPSIMMSLSALLLTSLALADTDWFGQAGAVDVNPIRVATLMENADEWLERPVMVSGRITDVCTHRGCWAVFEDSGEFLRITAEDHSFALPAEARGLAVAHGMLEKVAISPEHARHLVEDDGADAAVLEKAFEYRLIAKGVRLTPDP
jgi:hypothetical protein